MMTDQIYNWQADPSSNSFKHWFLIHVLTKAFDKYNEDPRWGEISDASNKFTEVEFEFKINGVAIPNPLDFLDMIDSQMEDMVQRAAKEMLQKQTSDEISRLTEQVDEFVELIEARFRRIALEQNVDTSKEYWKDRLI
jgi:uncharacterized protein YPO0396